ncbi:MAG: SidA/IucD/PvdA family monooxygenase, partial [Gordonia sp. (in: high G+C Gram-positive bacteria)]
MSTTDTVDILAIGCGPFNLGLAAMASTIDDLDILVVDARDEFRWHPGLMFPDATLQVSFLSDLVTLVDPTHPMSFLAYLADIDRLYPFLVREEFFPTRIEYEAYLQWVITNLDSLRFSTTVEEVNWNDEDEYFIVSTRSGSATASIRARHIVLGIGTEPHIPASLSANSPAVVHSSEYLYHRDAAYAADTVTVIGSGQSGAEIVIDLLESNLAGGPAVRWWTRSPWFAPLDFTKLSLEMTTPRYMDYFHGLPEHKRDEIRPRHWQFHKGISTDSLDRLHDLLYRRQLADKLRPVQLRNGTAVEGVEVLADGKVRVNGRHSDTDTKLAHVTDLVIAATGYRDRNPEFIAPIEHHLQRDAAGRPVIEFNHSIATVTPELAGRIFVVNAELHSHGASAPNLDIGAVRNARILNSVVGRDVYRLPQHTAFTSFGVTDEDDVVDES